MNGLATLLVPAGSVPVVMGMAGRPPSSAKAATGEEGFLGMLQQMMVAGAVHTASMMPILSVPAVLQAGTDGGPGLQTTPGIAVPSVAAGSTPVEHDPGILSTLAASLTLPVHEQGTEVDALIASPSAGQSDGEPHVPPGPEGSAADAQHPSTVVETQPNTGAITLPASLMLNAEERALAGEAPGMRSLVATPTVQEGTVPAPGAVARQGDDASPAQTAGATAKKPAVNSRTTAGLTDAQRSIAAKLADDGGSGSALRSGDRDPSTVHRATVKDDTDTPQTDRRAPVGAAVTRESASGEQGTAATSHQAPVTKPEDTKDATATDSPATPVKEEQAALRIVVAAKSAMGADAHDAESGKTPYQHLQAQLSPIRASAVRSDASATGVSDFLQALPTETTSNVIDQVVKAAALRVSGDTSEMHIKLEPASLGEVTLTVRMEGGQMDARIDVTQVAVKAALESSMGQLRDALSNHGIDVQRLDVSYTGQSFTRDTAGGHDEHSRRHGGKRQTSTEAITQYETGRLMGYNTMEMVM